MEQKASVAGFCPLRVNLATVRVVGLSLVGGHLLSGVMVLHTS